LVGEDFRLRDSKPAPAPKAGDESQWPQTPPAVQSHRAHFGPDGFFKVEKSLEQRSGDFSLELMAAYLERSHWDSKIFYLFEPELKLRLPPAGHNVQTGWSDILERIWRRYRPIGDAEDLAFHLGSLAGSMLHWRQAAAFFKASLRYCGEHSATHYNAGIAKLAARPSR